MESGTPTITINVSNTTDGTLTQTIFNKASGNVAIVASSGNIVLAGSGNVMGAGTATISQSGLVTFTLANNTLVVAGSNITVP